MLTIQLTIEHAGQHIPVLVLPTDAAILGAAGIPSILFGPGDPEVAHTPDESVDLNDVITAARFYALLGLRLMREG